MQKLDVVVGTMIAVSLALVTIARLVGFDPGATRPGLWLTGELVTAPVTDWSFAQKIEGTAIETRQWFLPVLAHSVVTTRFHYKERLYFGSGYPAGIRLPEGRHWNRNVMADPHVPIRVGRQLYDRTLVYVTDPIERDEVLKANGPRSWSPGFFLHLWRVEPLD